MVHKIIPLVLLFTLTHAGPSFLNFRTNSPSNDRPVIGVLTQPSDYNDLYPYKEYSYIADTYIEFVEASGARALPIRHDLPLDQLSQIFNGINGLIFPG
jgi:hypothetical protein